MIDRVTITAPAKINLRLVVLAREASGYHSLETIFCAISLADRIEIARGNPGIELSVSGDVDTGPPRRNLVVRAAEAFYAGIGEDPALRIRLRKRIPAAAGLGGGSSDAAATLRALNWLHGLPVDPDTLLRWAALLGSDVPFFLNPSPYALAWGRGERLLALPPLALRRVLVAHPGVAMSTPTAFSRLAETRLGKEIPTPSTIASDSLADWGTTLALAHNDFEMVAREFIPHLDQAKQVLLRAGAQVALLAGSGGAVFGIYRRNTPLPDVERQLHQLGYSTWRATTLQRWPRPVG
jgi:4-diphosphocytidyl-2-C-methyl-D-erythritol kinase